MEGVDPKKSAATELQAQNERQSRRFKAHHALVVGFFALILIFHVLGIYLFCSGFLLSRLVLQNRSECATLPIELSGKETIGTIETGCWLPKTFDKAVIVVVDALRYDFTVPFQPASEQEQPHHFHNALPVLYETSVREPSNSFLRPFIADPPTSTLQRLKGLMTGTLPTFIDIGSNFAGTAIDEDNLVEQLFKAGKKVVHLGDDTWHSLFPGLFEPNLTRPFESFNVWDLHTLDNGVNQHLFPLLETDMQGRWDVIIAHYLGVDHAGHRYGPDHPAMTDKLRQMDGIFRRIIERLDEDTLLVVMGDHGMDIKGDHGGESDDEVEAALWMYSKRGVFGTREGEPTEPPATAKERAVGQIDLVPTLALLLGLPVPFNNLGQPIAEAFLGPEREYRTLMEVNMLTAAQIHRYQGNYAVARGVDNTAMSTASRLWDTAVASHHALESSQAASDLGLKTVADRFAAYQAENLKLCRSLWARFDLVSMAMGIVTLLSTFALITLYAQGLQANRAAITASLVSWGFTGTLGGAVLGAAVGSFPSRSLLQLSTFGAATGGLAATAASLWPLRRDLAVPLPRSFWGCLCFLVTLMLCVGFAANSFTIWEDQQLLFILVTFGVLMLGASLGRPEQGERVLGAANAVSFIVATRLSSLSRLCREEQMPNCRSSYYASATSSTSAAWQLAIPFLVLAILPSTVASFFSRTRNYQGSAIVWVGYALRVGLLLVAAFWVLDVADDGSWIPWIPKETMKTSRVFLAQAVLALAFAAGYATYIMASPCVDAKQEAGDVQEVSAVKKLDPQDQNSPIYTPLAKEKASRPRPKLIILGYANTHGSRYLLLPSVWVLALLLVQKPMGQGTLALCFISILNVLEIIDANDLRQSPLGPVVFALLGSYYFFKTGHQAVLSTIQWESAFIPLKSLQYPWSPLLVVMNSYGPQILCAIAVPAIAMWKVNPKEPGLLGQVAGSMATHIWFYAAIAVATVAESAWSRRHLMLYRVFMPRMLVAITVLLLVEVVGTLIALLGLRTTIVSVSEVFGWAAT